MTEYGIFTDEGCIERGHFTKPAAEAVAVEYDAEAEQPGYTHVGVMCPCGKPECECEEGFCDCEDDDPDNPWNWDAQDIAEEGLRGRDYEAWANL